MRQYSPLPGMKAGWGRRCPALEATGHRFKGNHIKASHFERLREYLKLAEAAFSEEEDTTAQGTPFSETGAED